MLNLGVGCVGSNGIHILGEIFIGEMLLSLRLRLMTSDLKLVVYAMAKENKSGITAE